MRLSGALAARCALPRGALAATCRTAASFSPVGGPLASTPAARVRRTDDKGEGDMILLIAIVLGALVGAAASGEAGALAGALLAG